MKFVPNAVSTRVARQALVVQKNSPTLLFGVGVVGVVATTVLACRATLKVEAVLDDIQKDVRDIKVINDQHPDKYDEKSLKGDLALIYFRGSVKLAKLYGPAFVLGVTSIGALAGAHNILSKRNVALTAAYAAIEKGFDEYRKRVVDDLGVEKDREYRYGKETSEVIVEGKNGPKKIKKDHVSAEGASVYARFFNDQNKNWDDRLDYNIMFLRAKQNWATDRLRARGHVFLNEVFDDLGMERTKAGAVVGWVYDPRNPDHTGDGVVDFGIFEDASTHRLMDFVTGREGEILLDFNVDGVIYDKI